MVTRFDRDASGAGLSTASAASLGLTPYEVIISASVVEKEGYYAVNMPKVARVIYNRLAAGMPLQMDSTVLYALGQDGGPVTPQDLKIQSPYNTYLNTGLPPTPICMPSPTAWRPRWIPRREGGSTSSSCRRTGSWPSPTPTPSSWPTSSWPSHVDSPEPLLTMEEARARCGPEATVVGVIGSPIAHSLSPVLHNAAFAALGLAGWHSFAFEVPGGEAGRALEDVVRHGLRGLSVTMPHKADVAAAVGVCSDVARRLDAVNCVLNREGTLFGTNTDGQGFIDALARGVGFDPAARRCLVVGAGGAARAVILALAEAGAAEVAVLNRTPARAAEAAMLAGAAGLVVTGDVAAAVGRADLVVNATPVGMAGGQNAEAWPLAPELLRPGQVAADLVYVPRPTAWLERAAAAGATPLDGLGMLVHQAAAQLVLWTGYEAPVDEMWRSAEAALPGAG